MVPIWCIGIVQLISCQTCTLCFIAAEPACKGSILIEVRAAKCIRAYIGFKTYTTTLYVAWSWDILLFYDVAQLLTSIASLIALSVTLMAHHDSSCYQTVYDGNHVLQLKEICSHLADDMAREGLRGKTLTLKLKSAATFEVHGPSYNTTIQYSALRIQCWIL